MLTQSNDSQNLRKHQNHMEGLLKDKLLGPTSGVSVSVDLGWILRISISKKIPGDADVAFLGTTL